MVWFAPRIGLLAIGLAALLLGVSVPAVTRALEVVLKDVAPDRIERQRRNAEGQIPLPGTPNLAALEERLSGKGLTRGADVFIRIFKAESELELWMRKGDRFVLLDTYPICHWSGTLGPKVLEGDKQNPEGFYRISRRQLHLIGRWPRSLNVGYPNTYDRALGRTGSYILLHGGCSSVGCFAMTNEVMAEIYGLTEKALRSGQEEVDIHIFPFRMTEVNLVRYSSETWNEFWRNLKEGYDAFEATHVPPDVGVCGKKYVIEEVAPGEPLVTKRAAANGNRRIALRDVECGPRAAAASQQEAEEKVEQPPSGRRNLALKAPRRSPGLGGDVREASSEPQRSSR